MDRSFLIIFLVSIINPNSNNRFQNVVTEKIVISDTTGKIDKDIQPPKGTYEMNWSIKGNFEGALIINGDTVTNGKIDFETKLYDYYEFPPVHFFYDPYKSVKVDFKVILKFDK